MATRAIGGASAPPPTVPLDVLLSAIPSLPRPLLSRLTARMIERLDEIDGDPDLEPAGDEEDGNGVEDEPCAWFVSPRGPGCPFSDPDYGAEDCGELASWPNPTGDFAPLSFERRA